MSVDVNRAGWAKMNWLRGALELQSEYFVDCSMKRCRGVGVDIPMMLSYPEDRALRLEMLEGVPAVVLHGPSGDSGVPGLGPAEKFLLGTDEDVDSLSLRVRERTGAVPFSPSEEERIVGYLDANWNYISHSFGEAVDSHFAEKMSVKSMLSDMEKEVILDDFVMDNMTFYRQTRRMDDGTLDRLRREGTKLMGDFYKSRFESGQVSHDTVREELAYVRRVMDERFSARYSLMGKLDWRLYNLGSASGRKQFREKDVLSVADMALSDPSYAPYWGEDLTRWVKDRFREIKAGVDRIPDRYLSAADYGRRHREAGRKEDRAGKAAGPKKNQQAL